MESVKLMEGLEVLSVSGGETPILLSFFLLFLCFIVMILNVYAIISSIIEGFPAGAIIGLVLFVITVLLACYTISEIIYPSEIYKVLVDDSVPLNEFYENYKILDIDGKIYTIELKGAK